MKNITNRIKKLLTHHFKKLLTHFIGLLPIILYSEYVLGINHESFLDVLTYSLCLGFYSSTVCFWESRIKKNII